MQYQSFSSLSKSLERAAENSVFSCLFVLVIWFCCCCTTVPLGSLDAQGICAASFHTEAQVQTQLSLVETASPHHHQLRWSCPEGAGSQACWYIAFRISLYKWYASVVLLVAPARPRIKQESAAVWSRRRPPQRVRTELEQRGGLRYSCLAID